MTTKPASEIKIKAGDFLFQEKAPCAAMFYIKSGHILISRTSNGRKVYLGLVGAGEYVGEASVVVKNQIYSSSAEALTDIEAIQFTRESIEDQLSQVPSWLLGMAKGLIQKLQNANAILNRNHIHDESLAEKVAAILAQKKRKKTA